jgi:hypothetical protein
MWNGGVRKFYNQIWHQFERFIFNIYGTWYILPRDFLLNMKLKQGYTGREDEKEEVISCWTTLRKLEDSGSWKRKN